jgi:hypothetical protein
LWPTHDKGGRERVQRFVVTARGGTSRARWARAEFHDCKRGRHSRGFVPEKVIPFGDNPYGSAR